MAASSKKTTTGTKKRSTASSGRKSSTRRTTASRRTPRAADRADKSVEAFREALERSIREVVDDAVKRGRMTRDDANELFTKLVNRGRKQTEDLIKDLEKALEQARKEVETRATKTRRGVETRATKARKQVETRATKARKRARKGVGQARKAVVEAADEPLAQADKLRSRAGIPGFPITAYDELTAAQVKSRVAALNKADARKVRTYEKQNKARKSILDAIEKRLAA
jgi:polyhydroxyalkanoate synthesis regulator phasin